MSKWQPILLITCMLCVSCGGPPPPEPPGIVRDASELSRKAEAAYARGDLEQAIKFYSESLRLSRSIEDSDAIAANLINLAAVYRAAGDRDSSHETLQGLFVSDGLSYKGSSLARGAMLKALLLVDAGDLNGASDWVDRASGFCSESKCQAMGGILNLKARVLLLRDRLQEALRAAEDGLSKSRAAGDKAETANSIRLMADAHLASGDHKRSNVLYAQALEIDKGLAIPRKIALDLRGMAASARAGGDEARSREFFLRALDVAISGGQRDIVDEINLLLYEPHEENLLINK